MPEYIVACDCGSVEMMLTGKPVVHAYCHCVDCRELLNIPYHSVTAWSAQNAEIKRGLNSLSEFQHPSLEMKRIY